MAVYTPVSTEQVRTFLSDFDAGEYSRHVGIGSGIENTNYYLDTSSGRYVLTLFERLTAAQLPYYLEFTAHLANFGLPVAAPKRLVRGAHVGKLFGEVAGKPAALVNRLMGQDVIWPTPDHCAQIGALLARMHLASSSFRMSQPNLRGLPWIERSLPALMPHLPPRLAAMLAEEVSVQVMYSSMDAFSSLPRGPVHADLFRDNALFEADRLTGVIDFYFAGNDTWLFDFCVTLNDWCIDQATGTLDLPRARAFASTYQMLRPFRSEEEESLPLMARAAALRFWVSRLCDWYMPRSAAILTPKDPSHFERILALRQSQPVTLESLQ
jgi:homoserine kinase type II